MNPATDNPNGGFSRPRLVRRAVSVGVGLAVGAALWCTAFHSRPTQGLHPAEATSGQTAASGASPRTVRPRRGTWGQVGLASWYGARFQGRETAAGEPYNPNELTCAHRFLPLGTWIKVTNVHTGKWVVVRVNDRGPVPDTRITDLSSEAARLLGMRGRGVTRVRISVIDPTKAVEVARLDQRRQARLAAQAAALETGE